MKKRVISMLLGMLMILSVVLTGCSSGDDGDIIDVSQSERDDRYPLLDS